MNAKHRAVGGFSLVEVALALGLAGFCLVTVFGLLPVGINTNRGSIDQTAAAGIAVGIAADLRTTPLPNPVANQTTAYYQLTIPASPPSTTSTANTHYIFLRQDGTPASANPGTSAQDQAIDPTQNPRFRATIYYTSTCASGSGGTTVPKNAVAARILITWPPQADPASAGGVAGSFETFTSVARN